MKRHQQKVPWGFVHIVLIVVLTVLCWGVTLFGLHATGLLNAPRDITRTTLLYTALLYLVLYVIIVLVIGSAGGLPSLGYRSFGRRGLITFIVAVPSWYVLLIVVGTVGAALLNHGHALPSNVTTLFGKAPLGHLSAIDVILAFLVVSLIAPFVEETLFRGVLYQWLRGWAGSPFSIVLSALIFGALHFTPLLLPVLFMMGCLLAIVFQITKSLYVSMLLHSLNNTVTVLALLLGFFH